MMLSAGHLEGFYYHSQVVSNLKICVVDGLWMTAGDLVGLAIIYGVFKHQHIGS